MPSDLALVHILFTVLLILALGAEEFDHPWRNR
jgi:hypothetical protein